METEGLTGKKKSQDSLLFTLVRAAIRRNVNCKWGKDTYGSSP